MSSVFLFLFYRVFSSGIWAFSMLLRDLDLGSFPWKRWLSNIEWSSFAWDCEIGRFYGN
jgi:hypothetical protein